MPPFTPLSKDQKINTLLAEATALSDAPDSLATRLRIQTISQECGRLLRSYTEVASADQRFRDGLLEAAQKTQQAAVRLGMTTSAVNMKGISSLKQYDDRVVDLRNFDESFSMSVMTPDLLIEALESNFNNFSVAMDAYPIDERQLSEEMRRIDLLCLELMQRSLGEGFSEVVFRQSLTLLQTTEEKARQTMQSLSPETMRQLNAFAERVKGMQGSLEKNFRER